VTVLIDWPHPGVDLPRVDRRLLRSRALRALRAIGRSDAELSIAFVDDAKIAQLNEAYRAKAGATDVLSFSQLEGEHAELAGNLLGDVVISLETAARQARAAHRGLDSEVARLLVHGLLHLVGYDHEHDEEARVMQRLERQVRRAIDA
jgi:probable rRNA maturation factor